MFIPQIVLRLFGFDVDTEQEIIKKRLDETAKKNNLKKYKKYRDVPYDKSINSEFDKPKERKKEEIDEIRYSIPTKENEKNFNVKSTPDQIKLILFNNNDGFTIDLEMVENKGEDAPPILMQFEDGSKIIGVADGMGGAGGTLYNIDDTKRSGAYLASRAVNSIAEKYFIDFKEAGYSVDSENNLSIAKDLKYHFDTGLIQILNEIEKKGNAKSNIKSSMIKRLPTTFALSYFKNENNRIAVFNFWAGDSRIYSLNHLFGLRQLTSDDLKNSGDAYENLMNDSPISNCINADKIYNINVNYCEIEMPAIILTASDGAFAYLQTPIHFEQLLLETLVSSYDVDDWKKNLERKFRQNPSDDISLSLVVVGYNNFGYIKSCFYDRFKSLERELEELDLMSIKLQEQRSEVDEVNKAINEYKSRISRSEDEIDSMVGKFNFLIGSIDSVENENKKSEKIIEEKKREIIEIEKTIRKRKEEISNLKNEKEKTDRTIVKLENELWELKQNNNFELGAEASDKLISLKEVQENLKKELWLRHKEQYEKYLTPFNNEKRTTN